MIIRLFFVALILTALSGLAYYFSQPLLDYLQSLLSLDEAGRKRVLELMDIALKALGILSAVLGGIAVITKYVLSGKKNDDASKTVIEGDVRVHGGDFVMGNKTQQGGKDAGQS